MQDLGKITTLTNWQDPPFDRWAFLHVDQVLPTVGVQRLGAPVQRFAAAERDILHLPTLRGSGAVSPIGDVLRDTETDAFLVLQHGAVVHESYTRRDG